MSRWTSREDIPFETDKNKCYEVSGCPNRIAGGAQIFLDKCPYFVPQDDGARPYALCSDESGAGECLPFTEWCRLYELIEQAQEEILKIKKLDTRSFSNNSLFRIAPTV